MPIQAGTYKVRGKMENRSYYKPKYSAHHLVRSINQQMSERVKTEPGFANTRKYAAEFGVSSGMSNEIFGVLKNCGCVVNNPRLRSRLASILLEYVKTDTEHALGQRTLNNYFWQNNVRSFLNTCSRVPFSNLYASDISLIWGTPHDAPALNGSFSIRINLETQNNALLTASGIKTVTYNIRVYAFYAKEYVDAQTGYLPTESRQLLDFTTSFEDSKWSDIILRNVSIRDLKQFEEKPKSLIVAFVSCYPSRSANPEEDQLRSMSSWCALPIVRTSSTTGEIDTFISSLEYYGHTFLNNDAAPIINRDIQSYVDVQLFYGPAQAVTSATAKINGTNASVRKIGYNTFRVTIPVLLDGEPLLTLGLTSGLYTYGIELLPQIN